MVIIEILLKLHDRVTCPYEISNYIFVNYIYIYIFVNYIWKYNTIRTIIYVTDWKSTWHDPEVWPWSAGWQLDKRRDL